MASGPDSPPDPADVLRELLELRGYSVRGLAKELAGDGATDRQWENQRREITEWLRGRRRGGNDPDDGSLEELAAALAVPSYLLTLLYRQADREEQLRGQVRQLAEELGLQLPAA